MTLEILRRTGTDAQGEREQGSNSITAQQLPEEFLWIDISAHSYGRGVPKKEMTATTMRVYEYGTEPSIGSVYIPNGKVSYRLAPFLDGDRVEIDYIPDTDFVRYGESELLSAVGPNIAVQAIRPESGESYAVFPPAKDATNVVPFAPETVERVNRYLLRIIRDSADEVFFDGMDSTFTNKLRSLLQFHGEITVRVIEDVVKSGDANSEAVGEILRVLGSDEDPVTHGARVAVLLASLQLPDPSIRDAASLGIASLDDPSLLNGVLAAVNREQIPQLRRNLQLVADQLQLTIWHGS